MRSIPIRLLCHEAVLVRERDNGSLNGGETTEMKVAKVRIDVQSRQVSLGNSGATNTSSATLYFFPGVSTVGFKSDPASFADGNKVIFNGREWLITGSREVFDRIGLSHLEVNLV